MAHRSARNRSFFLLFIFFLFQMTLNRFFFWSFTHLDFTVRFPPPDPRRVFLDEENVNAHASNFLNLLANDDRIISSDLGGSMFSVIK